MSILLWIIVTNLVVPFAREVLFLVRAEEFFLFPFGELAIFVLSVIFGKEIEVLFWVVLLCMEVLELRKPLVEFILLAIVFEDCASLVFG